MNTSTNTDALLAEYNVTQNRLENISDAQNALFIFAFTATGAILAFSLQQLNPYISLVSFAILVAVRCRVMWFRNSYYNELAYLRVILEPQLKLNTSVKFEVKTEGISVIQYFIYTFLGAGAVLAYSVNNPENIIAFIIGIGLMLIVLLLDCYYYFFSRNLYKKLVARWEEVKNNT